MVPWPPAVLPCPSLPSPSHVLVVDEVVDEVVDDFFGGASQDGFRTVPGFGGFVRWSNEDMARKLNQLTTREVTALTARGRHADGGGLYLQVDGHGTRQWTFRFQIDGKRSEMRLGSAIDLSLANARVLAAQCRADVEAGRNPLTVRIEAKKADERARKITASGNTFGDVAKAMLDAKEHGWRNEKHKWQWRQTLEGYGANLWSMPVADIRTEDVVACLAPIWTEKAETASRTRGRIEAVLNAARARGLIPEDRANPARWRGHLDHLLPKRKRLQRGHHAALPWKQVPEFIAKLRLRPAVTARALEVIILTAARSGEVRGMTWDEVDLVAKVWTVPGERMKMGKPHRVPLSNRAIAVMRSASTPAAGQLVFPFGKQGKALSDMAFKSLYERMDYDDITTHGFRSAFRDWAGEATDFPRELAEAALAHLVGDAVERAYRRGDALEKRRALMEAWAAFCEPAAT